jgi:acetamidase/formamidase
MSIGIVRHTIVGALLFVTSTHVPGLVSAQTTTLPLSAANVHWGYFSKTLDPVLTVASGTEVVVEMATHHACDDWDKMIMGDAAMEEIYTWTGDIVGEEFRGASGGGDGVHILTGPIFVEDAEPGDILKVEILDLQPRPNQDGKTFGSNAAAWWGFQARVNKADNTPFYAGSFSDTPTQNDEIVTIYEIVEENGQSFAVPSYQFEWPIMTDPNGVERDYIAYPGTCVPHDTHSITIPSSDVTDMGWTKSGAITYYDNVFKAKIPINYHVGCMGLAPASHDFVDSIPPMPTGGNLDNKRIGVGTTMYYPVEVAGGLISMGDAHAAQGDSELDGTGIETSITGKFKLTVIKQEDFTASQAVLDFPLGETATDWIVHGYVENAWKFGPLASPSDTLILLSFSSRFTETDYLDTYFDNPGAIYDNSSIDKATKNTFTQTRKFLMAEYGLTEAEVWTIVTQGVDFGMTQAVDGNWGVHALVPKAIFIPFTEETPPISTFSNRKLQGDVTLPLSAANVHWGYFSKTLDPVLTVASGTEVVVEMATHHACDDWDKMIMGDAAMEEIYTWTGDIVGEEFRGASGGGDGVHILTGPIFVEDAEPGDILKVEILDLQPRPNQDGKTFGSNAAAWWGFQARVNKADNTPFYAGSFSDTPTQNDEIVTIYEIVEENGQSFAVPSYQFEWPIMTDPNGVERDYIAYPGTCVPHDTHSITIPSSDVTDMGWTKSGAITYYDNVFKAKIPINYHVGCMGLAPASHDFVDSIPPMPTGGNLDNKRIGVGTTMYYPVEVAGGLISMGDAHAAQGDSELDGTGIETSITGKFKLTVIKQEDFTASQAVLDFPLGETATDWIIHGFTATDYLETYADNPAAIYNASSIDAAAKNTFTQTRKFLMAEYDLTEAEAWTIITQGVDFGMTQLVDGNWGVHAIVPKAMFDLAGPRNTECELDTASSLANCLVACSMWVLTLVAMAVAL